MNSFCPLYPHRSTVVIIVNIEILKQHKTPAVSTVVKIKELKVIIVQTFQDGAHSDDMTMRQQSLLTCW